MSVNNDITVEAYNQNAQKYIDAINFQNVLPSIQQWLDKRLDGLHKSALVLEIGAGDGEASDYIESQGFTVERTDAAKAFVELMVKRGKDATVFNCIDDDFTKEYDVIFAEAVFLHFTKDDLTQVLAKCLKALKPGGKLLFSVKEGAGEVWENKKLGAKRYFHFWQPKDIQKVMEKIGFQYIEVDVIPDHRGKVKPNWLYTTGVKESA